MKAIFSGMLSPRTGFGGTPTSGGNSYTGFGSGLGGYVPGVTGAEPTMTTQWRPQPVTSPVPNRAGFTNDGQWYQPNDGMAHIQGGSIGSAYGPSYLNGPVKPPLGGQTPYAGSGGKGGSRVAGGSPGMGKGGGALQVPAARAPVGQIPMMRQHYMEQALQQNANRPAIGGPGRDMQNTGGSDVMDKYAGPLDPKAAAKGKKAPLPGWANPLNALPGGGLSPFAPLGHKDPVSKFIGKFF